MLLTSTRIKHTLLYVIFFLSLSNGLYGQIGGCNVASVDLATAPNCTTDSTYYFEILIKHRDVLPEEGDLIVQANAQTFEVPIAPDQNNDQNIRLELPTDFGPVDLTIYYEAEPDCKTIARDFTDGITGCGRIGDQVWLDDNQNGLQDPGEEGVPGVKVTLMLPECQGAEEAEAITDANGNFLFEELCAGTYQLKVELPEGNKGYAFTTYQAGNDITLDSDIRTEQGMSDFFNLKAGEQLMSMDIGLTACPQLNGLVCNNTLNVSLDDSCERLITPELLIENEIPCDADLDLRLFDDTGFIGNRLTDAQVGKTVTAIVEDRVTGLVCTTELVVEDKLGPVIECTSLVETGLRLDTVQFLTGQLTNTDSDFDPSKVFCWEGLNAAGANFYDTLNFSVDSNDLYSLVLFTDWGGGAGAIYYRTFDTNQPCLNVITSKVATNADPTLKLYQDFGPNLNNWVSPAMEPVLELSLPLRSGKTYQLITSSAASTQTGNYTWAIRSNKNGRLIAPEALDETIGLLNLDIICTNFDSIFGSAASQTYLPIPIIQDNCAEDVELLFSDAVKRKSFCGPNAIERTFTAIDPSGNETICLQEIKANNPQVNDIVLPPETVFLHCDEVFGTDENGNPDAEAGGAPFVWTLYGAAPIDDSYCNMSAGYEDEVTLENCSGSYTVFRKWIIVDFCNPFNRLTYEQVIRVVDDQAPVFDLKDLTNGDQHFPDTLIYSTGAFDCTGAFEVPIPEILENCSASTQLLIEVVSEVEVDILEFGVPVGKRIETQVLATVNPGEVPAVFGIPVGCHRFRYTATDDCDNKATIEYPFCVEDRIAPIVICEDNLTLSLGGEGVARLAAQIVDNGSFDACALDSMKIRREYTRNADCSLRAVPAYSSFSEFVDFDCCDAGDTVNVELLVIDKSGNANTCWMTVTIEDKIRPLCIAPPSTTVKCNQLPANFDPTDVSQLADLFGTPEPSADNCSVVRFEELTPTVDLDDCQVGRIQRRFRVYDQADNASTNVCTQTITIEAVFDYAIRFPADVDVDCEVPESEDVFVEGIGCDLLATRVEDEVFTGGSDACYKVFRTYSIINWCEYDSESDPVIVRRDEDCDGFAGDEPVWVVRRPDQAYIDQDSIPDNQTPRFATKSMNCDGETNPEGHWRKVNSNGFWTYLQIISVYDRDAPTLIQDTTDAFCSLDNDNCQGMATITFQVDDACSAEGIELRVFFDAFQDGIQDLEVTNLLTGTYPDYQVEGTFTIGAHALQVQIEDACNNESNFDLPFEVKDCKAPSPICQNVIAVFDALPDDADVDGDGEADRAKAVIWASDIVGSNTIDDCSAPVIYSVNRVGEVPSPEQDSVLFTCKDSIGFFEVELHAWDAAGNHDFCVSTVELQDNGFGICETFFGSIAGAVKREDNSEMPNVEVVLEMQDEVMNALTTNNRGIYDFSELKEGEQYSITPKLDIDAVNGVSTLDLVTISRHILGIEFLDSPYKMIAADANNSETITTLDLIFIRKVILRIERQFPSNTSWRFVDAEYSFPVPTNPWIEDFPEFKTIDNLAGAAADVDFMGIKVGDINNSAFLDGLLPPIETRSQYEPLKIQAIVEESASNTIAVHFKAENLDQFLGFQTTLHYESLYLSDLTFDVVQPSQMGVHETEEAITLSWHQPNHEATLEENLFTLHFTDASKADVYEALRLSSTLTQMEAYTDADPGFLAVADIELLFPIEATSIPTFEVGQNLPNPVRAYTKIPVSTSQSTQLSLTIYDNQGRMVYEQTQPLEAGQHFLDIDCTTFENGIYTYHIQTDLGGQSRRMVVVK